MPKDSPSNTVLHMNRSIMSENDSAVIEKRALQDLIEVLNAEGIKCRAAISKRDNVLVTQYYARIGGTLVPIGHADTRKLTAVSPLGEYSLNYYLKDSPAKYGYTIMAYCQADATEAASAFCKNRHVSQATLVDIEDNFVWEF